MNSKAHALSTLKASSSYTKQCFYRRQEATHKQKFTEVDRWLAALEAEEGTLPKKSDIFGIQEALFNAGFRSLGDLDHLDPGVRGDFAGDWDARRSIMSRQMEMLEVPGLCVVLNAFCSV
jgi:hypothetical protein